MHVSRGTHPTFVGDDALGRAVQTPQARPLAGAVVGVGLLMLRSYLLGRDTGHYDGVIAAMEARKAAEERAEWLATRDAQILYLSVLDFPSNWRIAAPSRTFIPELRKRVFFTFGLLAGPAWPA